MMLLRLACSLAVLGSVLYTSPVTGQPSAALVIDDRWPRFAPDNATIAFSSNRGGTMGIYVMKADGSSMRSVPVAGEAQTHYFGPSWFPDGNLLYAGDKPTTASGVDNGLDATSFIESSPAGENQRILYQGINAERPAASPSGKLLVFEAEHGPFSSKPNIDLYVLDIGRLNGAGGRLLTTPPPYRPAPLHAANVKLQAPIAATDIRAR